MGKKKLKKRVEKLEEVNRRLGEFLRQADLLAGVGSLVDMEKRQVATLGKIAGVLQRIHGVLVTLTKSTRLPKKVRDEIMQTLGGFPDAGLVVQGDLVSGLDASARLSEVAVKFAEGAAKIAGLLRS